MSRETFESLLAPHLRLVRMLVMHRVTAGEVEDVVQEILLRAFARRDQLRTEANFRNWLWSIALNEIHQYFRRDRRDVSFDELPHFDIRDATTSPLARVERLEARDWLRARMAQLTDREQATIRLRDIEERSVRETAAALHSSVAAAKTAHFRARQRLARIVRASTHRAGCASIGRAA